MASTGEVQLCLKGETKSSMESTSNFKLINSNKASVSMDTVEQL